MAQVVEADSLTSKLGAESCRQFRQHVFSEFPTFAIDLALRYNRTAERFNAQKANQELLEIHNRLRIGDLNLCADTDDLKTVAERCAQKCDQASRQASTIQKAYLACVKIVERYQLTAPEIQTNELQPAINRMTDKRWWFRQIKTLRLRTLETIARQIELVNRNRSTYTSDYSVHLKRKQKQNNRDYLSSTFISNELGESYSLQDLADRSVSNPAIRRAELMVRIRGFETVAQLCGHVGEFYTLTTPSRMHACLHNGKINPRFDGTTTLEAHEYLTHLWALIRAELHRQSIRPYGFRVVEPHHDGTPHWHLLLFLPPEQKDAMREIMRHYALAENGNEPGAQTHRFKAVAIDPTKGTAAGYIAKYIAKNIDGHKLEHDLYGQNAAEAAERITTWANVWGIRQFQQIGGPSVSVWRQLRRMEKTNDESLEHIRQAATASDWAAFMLAQGDYQVSRNKHPLKPLYGHSQQLNTATGEIITKQTDTYNGPAAQRVIGLIWKMQVLDNRKHFWTLSHRDSDAKRGDCEASAEQRTAEAELSTRTGLAASIVGRPEHPVQPMAKPVFLDLYQ